MTTSRRSFSESYTPRNFPGYNGDCEEIEGVGVCWGPVRNSSKGMRCEGHRGPIFRPEPVPPTPEELKAQAVARAEKARGNLRVLEEVASNWGWTIEELAEDLQKNCLRTWGPKDWDEWQRNRWFRPFLGMRALRDRPPSPEWARALPDSMLLMLHSALAHWVGWGGRISPQVSGELLRIGAFATWELRDRGVSKFPRGPYQFNLIPSSERPSHILRWPYKGGWGIPDEELQVKADLLSETELRVLYSLFAEIEDFSCLNWATRLANSSWSHQLREEKDRRGLEVELLLEEVVLPVPPMTLPPDEKGRRVIGYWADKDGVGITRGLPLVQFYVDPSWGSGEKAAVLRYLRNGYDEDGIIRFMGFSECRLCGCSNGCSEFFDGTYRWPEGFAHYVEAHDVRPDQEFIDYVLLKKGE